MSARSRSTGRRCYSDPDNFHYYGVNSSAVPEPAALSLVGGTLLGLGMLRRKRFSRQ